MMTTSSQPGCERRSPCQERSATWPRRLARCLVILGLLQALGCGNKASYERYIPKVEVAQQALEAALNSWQKGEPPGRLTTMTTPIQFVDSHRRRGQRLVSYTILGETAGNSPRCFAVKLGLDNPREEKQVRFVVLGIDPLWVFRHEDYDMMAHWEHPMSDDAKPGKQ